MIIPSECRAFLDQVFADGPDNYIHPTGFYATRVITGVSQPAANPYYVPPGASGRAMISGERLFTADNRESAFREAMRGAQDVPYGTYILSFEVTGNTMDHSLVPDPRYQQMFLDPNDHSFSQSVASYFEEKNWTQKFATHGWLSVRGEGYVHGCPTNQGGEIRHLGTEPVPEGLSVSEAIEKFRREASSLYSASDISSQ
jgi:hypothetical protein